MDYKALIEFNKYTLALAAVGFAYTLEKLVPAKSQIALVVVLALLAIFLVSVLLGIGVFAVATSSLHHERSYGKKLISVLGTTHAVMLALGMIVLGVMLIDYVITAKPKTNSCYCALSSESPSKTIVPVSSQKPSVRSGKK